MAVGQGKHNRNQGDGWGRCESGRESYRRGMRVGASTIAVKGEDVGWVGVRVKVRAATSVKGWRGKMDRTTNVP